MSETETIVASSDKDNQKKSRWPLWSLGTLLVLLIIFVPIVRKSGTVVDADTSEPIEGAIVLVEWTLTGGLPGMSSTASWKVVEAVTDKYGRFTILGTFNPLTNDPYITIYMHGYVAWNNIQIFPGTIRRQDFEWKDENIYEMERFEDSFSYETHQTFINGAAHPESNSRKKTTFMSEYRKWERDKTIGERTERHKGRSSGR